MTRRLLDIILDIVYPPRCPVCNELVSQGEVSVCKRCESLLTYVEEPYCFKCGKSIEDEMEEYCNDCKDGRHFFDEGRSVLLYDEYMSKSMYRFKYNGKQEYARFYGKIIYERLAGKIKTWNPDVIIPVPIHKSRLNKRGFNQADLIAKELSKYAKIPVDNHILKRKIPTKVMKNLDAKERENNLKKAFIVTENVVKLNSVVIIDDIYTTGSTVDAISRVLRNAGVSKIYFITVCIGRGY